MTSVRRHPPLGGRRPFALLAPLSSSDLTIALQHRERLGFLSDGSFFGEGAVRLALSLPFRRRSLPFLGFSLSFDCLQVLSDTSGQGLVRHTNPNTTNSAAHIFLRAFHGPIRCLTECPSSLPCVLSQRTRTLIAVCECELCFITRAEIQVLMQEYPELEARLQR